MDLLGFDTREQLIDFLNSPDRPTGNMVPEGQIQRDMQILVEGKEEIHRLFISLDDEALLNFPVELMANGRKPEADHAQHSTGFDHREADATVAGSESTAETFKATANGDPWQRAVLDAWAGLLGKAGELPAPVVSGAFTDERIISTVLMKTDRRVIDSGEAAGQKFPNKVSEMSDEALIAMHERNDSGIRAIWRFVRETTSMLGVVLLGWKARRRDAVPLQTSTVASQFSVRRTWLLLTGVGIVTAWFFSPFNAFPAIVLLALSVQFGFNCLKKRPTPVFLKSALLILVLFVLTGIVHDAFFDHPAALCADGRYSYSASRSGTCSWHDGVSRWNPERRHWWQYGIEFNSSGTPSQKGRRHRISSPL
jgi:hypothetical protein